MTEVLRSSDPRVITGLPRTHQHNSRAAGGRQHCARSAGAAPASPTCCCAGQSSRSSPVTGDRRPETGDRRPVSGVRRPVTGGRRPQEHTSAGLPPTAHAHAVANRLAVCCCRRSTAHLPQWRLPGATQVADCRSTGCGWLATQCRAAVVRGSAGAAPCRTRPQPAQRSGPASRRPAARSGRPSGPRREPLRSWSTAGASRRAG